MPVPNNVQDLDSDIVARFIEIWELREDPDGHEGTVASIARVKLGLFIEQACDTANVRYDYQIFGVVLEQAAEDYAIGYNSGGQRRSVLFKMVADVKDLILTLDKKPEEIDSPEEVDWSDKLKKYLDRVEPFKIALNPIDFRGVPSPYGVMNGSTRGPNGGGKTLGLHGDPANYKVANYQGCADDGMRATFNAACDAVIEDALKTANRLDLSVDETDFLIQHEAMHKVVGDLSGVQTKPIFLDEFCQEHNAVGSDGPFYDQSMSMETEWPTH